MSDFPVHILGTGHYVPEKKLTNADLEKLVDTTDEWITARTGIKERRIASESELTSDMATAAARNALEMAQLTPDQIDLIIVATITPDVPTPATACYVQEKLGAKRGIAFDISAACCGFLYAMDIARHYLSRGMMHNALIIGVEMMSSLVDWTDRNTCVLFGDGAGAAILSNNQTGSPILSINLGADGSQTEILKVPGGGTASRAQRKQSGEENRSITMMGREVFRHAVVGMTNAANYVLQRAGLTAEEVEIIIPHQANMRIIEAVGERLEVPSEKVFVNLHHYGNTSAAAVAIALDEANRSGAIKKGDHALLIAFGAGLTWACALIEW